MRRRSLAPILNAEGSGFRSDAAVERLGKTRVGVQIHLDPFPPLATLAPLAPLRPAARGRALRDYYKALYERLRPLLPPNCRPSDRECRTCTCVLSASSLRDLRRHASVQFHSLVRCRVALKSRPDPAASGLPSTPASPSRSKVNVAGDKATRIGP
jgi:hypothetical protein